MRAGAHNVLLGEPMKLKWFVFTHSVCKKCGVHFEPRNDQWADLCLMHRQPVMERDRKRDAVIQWARENWEKLYEQYEKEDFARRAAYNAMNQVGMNSMTAQAQQAAMAQSNIYDFGRLGPF